MPDEIDKSVKKQRKGSTSSSSQARPSHAKSTRKGEGSITSKEQAHSSSGNKRAYILAAIPAVALIVAAIVAAVIPNWHTWWTGTGTVVSNFSGYIPSNDWKKEVKTYFRASGWCDLLEHSQKEFFNEVGERLRCNSPDGGLATHNPITIALKKIEKRRTCKDFVDRVWEIYKGRYDIKQMHELNRFYHTKVMNNLVTSKMDGLAKDFAKIQAELLDEAQNELRIEIEKDNTHLPPNMRVFLPPACPPGPTAPN